MRSFDSWCGGGFSRFSFRLSVWCRWIFSSCRECGGESRRVLRVWECLFRSCLVCFGKFVETSSIYGVWGIFSGMLVSGVSVVWCGLVSCKDCGGEGPIQFSCLLILFGG